MYGKDVYGLIRYGLDTYEDGVDPEEYFVDLAQYAPPFLRGIRELAAIWKTEGYEIGLLEYYINDLLNQAFVVTATWGLTLWEEMYGVVTNLSLSYEQRREIIIAKMRGQGTTTIEMIKQTAMAFSGGEVEIIEDNPNSIFTIRFIGILGIPQNMNAFVVMLEDIKPAHLAYRFEYRYTTWGDLSTYSWGGLSALTWDGLRTVKEAE